MKFFLLIFSLVISTSKVFAQNKKIFDKAAELYFNGQYTEALIDLDKIQTEISQNQTKNQEDLGLTHYWKGLINIKLFEYEKAINHFNQAISLKYIPKEIYYELGQAYFASDKLDKAEECFKKSISQKYKKAVSMYYVGYIAKELKDYKRAFKYFRGIQKLTDDPETSEVIQSAEFQIGDIYLDKVERHPDAFRAVDNHVIPQYEKALSINTKSNLASKIQEKIAMLQRKYDLILLQLRNGRPVLNPPYFLRLNLETGYDSNVTFSPNNTTVLESDKASSFYKVGSFGKYTFYYSDFISISPEIGFTQTKYLKREEQIYKNDSRMFFPALRTAYEYNLGKKAASHLFDLEYSDVRRDVNSREKLDFNSSAKSFSLGERINYLRIGETTIRYKQRELNSYIDFSDSTTRSLILEQVLSFKSFLAFFYMSYDELRNKDNMFDTDSLTTRVDFLLPTFKNWFTPVVGMGITRTNPINDVSNRGIEYLYNPSVRLNRNLDSHWRTGFKFDYQLNQSKDTDQFAFRKALASLEIEYLY